jgi:hypothetical protein
MINATRSARPDSRQDAVATDAPRRWLLFASQLPTSPSHLRVRTWRRLQQLGAIAVKQALYALPDTPAAREDFEWLKTSVIGDGGDASIFTAASVDAAADDDLVEGFRRARQASYDALADEVQAVLGRLERPRRGARMPAVDRLVRGFTERLAALEGIDFFGSAGRDRVVSLVRRLEKHGRPSPEAAGAAAGASAVGSYVGRLWVTRPRPGVDRMSSAWLIRRFVDARARFSFATDVSSIAEDAVAFDMFGAEFSHRGDACTFETLRTVFNVHDDGVERIAGIVHDLDLKDGRFSMPEAPTVGTVIDGLQLATPDDAALLEQGILLFDSLYRGFTQHVQTPRPRAMASPAKPAARARRSKR